MPRKTRPLNRDSGVVRDASLMVIASEDKYAVKQYFAHFRMRRVQIEVIETLNSGSAPQHVLDRLDKFKAEYETEQGDQFWLCVDRDRWPDHILADTLRECLKKGYGIALSVPCFELWILLHHEELSNEFPHKTAGMNDRLRTVLNGYTKQCCKRLRLTEEMVVGAMRRNRDMDPGDGHLIPANAVSRVYKILDAMKAKDMIEFIDVA